MGRQHGAKTGTRVLSEDLKFRFRSCRRLLALPLRRGAGAHQRRPGGGYAVVGLPDKAVAESRERVRNALHAVGLGLPYKHITVKVPILLGFFERIGAHCAGRWSWAIFTVPHCR